MDERYKKILDRHFAADGYRPNSYLDRKRFQKYFRAEFGEECSEDRLDEILTRVGVRRNDRIYPERESNLIEEIVADIRSVSDSGAAVSIDCVYEKYRARLAAELNIYDQKTFTQLILSHIEELSCLSRIDGSAEDILSIVKRSSTPLSFRAICERAWYIPAEEAKKILRREKAVVKTARDMYFYAPNFPLDESELEQLSSLIRSEINSRGCINDAALIKLIRENFPSAADNLIGFGASGVRHCLKYFLGDRFLFRDSIISSLDVPSDPSAIFSEFIGARDEMTFDELKNFSTELGIKIPWACVLEKMIRVSRTRLVSNERIDFDVEAIDSVLDELCPGDYVPLKEINLFLSFPGIGYPWNAFVLESYLFKHSRKFRLMHSTFGEDFVCGALVRSDCSIADYRSLIVDALSRSDAWNTEREALQFIVERGYKRRRMLRDIENVIADAKKIRERRNL